MPEIPGRVAHSTNSPTRGLCPGCEATGMGRLHDSPFSPVAENFRKLKYYGASASCCGVSNMPARRWPAALIPGQSASDSSQSASLLQTYPKSDMRKEICQLISGIEAVDEQLTDGYGAPTFSAAGRKSKYARFMLPPVRICTVSRFRPAGRSNTAAFRRIFQWCHWRHAIGSASL